MIKITLTDGYFVEVEGVDHVLKRHTTTQPKKDEETKEVVKKIGYFSSMTQALVRYLKEVQSEEAHGMTFSMEEYINAIATINKKAVEDILANIER